MYRFFGASFFIFERVIYTLLKLNDRGSLVEAIQLALYRSGFLSKHPDGIFGQQTENAVKSFQREFGLDEDGIVGEKTLLYAENFIKGYYIKEIKNGDTLWQTAVQNGISLNSLITANPTIDIDNLTVGEKITVPYAFNVVPTDIHYSYYLTQLLLDGLAARYPFAIKENIGSSVMGKQLTALTFGNGDKSLFVNAGIHANEYLNIPIVLRFTEEYMKAIANGLSLYENDTTEIYNNTRLTVLPLINPDGLDLVTNALNSGEYYDKAEKIASYRPEIPFPNGWKANINGIDLNLQFPADWETAKNLKTTQGYVSPSPIEFPGDTPLSQPESIALYDFTKKNDFRITASYHSQGNLIYWKFKNYLPKFSREIGEILEKVSGYPLTITPPDSDFAGYKDWFIQEYSRPSYTVETGTGTNPLPLNQFNEIYPPNARLLTALLSETSKL